MPTKKLSLLLLIFISVLLLSAAPVSLALDANTPRLGSAAGAQIKSTHLQTAVAQLMTDIETAFINLTKSDTDLKAKLAAVPAGIDISTTQTAITGLETQIANLQTIIVPAAPATASDLTVVRRTFQTVRTAAQKDINTANQSLQTILQSAAQIARIKAQGDKAVDLRITSLNARIAKFTALKNLSDIQKAGFASQFQTRITALTALKAKIDADTDVAAIKTDYQSIFNDYRIFAIFEPEMNITVQADTIIARVNALLTRTTDSGALAKLNDALTQANAAVNKVASLTPADYPAVQVLTDARSLLKLARIDITGVQPLKNQK